MAGTSVITNVNIIIDTDKVIQDNPNPSKDPNNPTGLQHNSTRHYQYMVVSGNEAITGQGTADLNFLAYPGDVVRMSMVSEYNNLDNPVLIYKINKYGGTQVFSDFDAESITTKTIVPSGEDVLPPSIEDETFWYYQANVENTGTENYRIYFVMYQRVRGGDPKLFGYFYWDPTITVKGG